MFFPSYDMDTALKFIRYIGTHMGIGQWDMFSWGLAMLYLALAGDYIARFIRMAGGLFGISFPAPRTGTLEDSRTLEDVLSDDNRLPEHSRSYSFSDRGDSNQDAASHYLSVRRK